MAWPYANNFNCNYYVQLNGHSYDSHVYVA